IITKSRIDYVLNNKEEFKVLDLQAEFNLNNFIEFHSDLVQLGQHIHTPKKVSKKVAFFEFCVASSSAKDYNKQSLILFGGRKFTEDKDAIGLVNSYNNLENLTPRLFLEKYLEIINECVSWLDDNSYSIGGLNI
ncbi:MAG: hypothetical protein ABFS32_22610, partial [Bacteroidota bacterium]